MFNFMRLPPLRRLMLMKAITGGGSWSTITGNPVSFTAKAAPLRKLQVAFSPVQSGSGDPSPDNVRPISGWSSLTVEQTGANLYDGEWEYGNISDSTGQNSGTSTSYFRSKNYIPVPHSTQFYWLNAGRTGTFRQYYYDKDKTYLGYSGERWNRQIPLTSAEYYDRIAFVRFRVSGERAESDDKISINYPSTDTAYHAYNPSSRSISISLGETVYSGYVDVVTGVGEVTSVAKMASALEWVNNGTYANTFNGTGFTERKQRIEGSIVNGCFCDSYAWYDSSQVGTRVNGIALAYNSSGSIDNRTRIYIKDSRFANAAEFVASLQNDDVMIALPLATPFTIQLTPQEVESLAGDNNLWSDANQPLTVTYRSN